MIDTRRVAQAVLFTLSAFLTAGVSILIVEAVYLTANGHLYASKVARAERGSSATTTTLRTFRRLPPSPHAHEYRVVTLGGSTTYGMGLEEEQTWPYLLQERLHAASGEAYEVLNLGYLGGHLEQIRENFVAISTRRVSRYDWISAPSDRPGPSDLLDFGVQDLQTRVVILTPIVNDTVPDFFMTTHWSDGLCRNLRGGRLSRYLAFTYYTCELSLGRRSAAAPRTEARLPGILRGFRSRLQAFVEDFRANPALRGTSLVLMSLPTLFHEGERAEDVKRAATYWGRPVSEYSLAEQARYYPMILRMEEEVIAEIAAKYGLPYFRLFGLFDEISFRKRLQFFNDAVHVNAEGAAKVATVIVREMQQEGL